MDLWLTSLVISLFAALSVWLMGRRDPAGRPWLTAVFVLLLLALPLLAWLPKYHVESVVLSGGLAEPEGVSWWMAVWVAGVVLMFGRLWHRCRVLRRWLGESELCESAAWQVQLRECIDMLGMAAGPELRVKSGLVSPVLAGMRQPVILIPDNTEAWSAETRKMVLLHELAHLQRRDLWVRTAAEVACAIHWYNPLVWWLRAKLFSQCEYACDAHVVARGADRRDYIRALCEVVESVMEAGNTEDLPSGVCAMADHAPLKLRAARLLENSASRGSWVAVVAALVTVSSALGFTLVRPVAGVDEGAGAVYSEQEIELRHSANPFPGN